MPMALVRTRHIERRFAKSSCKMSGQDIRTEGVLAAAQASKWSLLPNRGEPAQPGLRCRISLHTGRLMMRKALQATSAAGLQRLA